MTAIRQPSGMTMTAVLGAIGKGHLTIEQMAEHLPIDRKAVINAAGRLTVRGLIERVEIGHYRLTGEGIETLKFSRPIKPGPRGPRANTPRFKSFRQRAWAAMRLTGRFTVGELVTLAGSGRERNPETNLNRYLAALVKHGVVAELPARARGTAPTSNGFKVYRLMMDLGEIAPACQRSGELIDYNTREASPCA